MAAEQLGEPGREQRDAHDDRSPAESLGKTARVGGSIVAPLLARRARPGATGVLDFTRQLDLVVGVPQDLARLLAHIAGLCQGQEAGSHQRQEVHSVASLEGSLGRERPRSSSSAPRGGQDTVRTGPPGKAGEHGSREREGLPGPALATKDEAGERCLLVPVSAETRRRSSQASVANAPRSPEGGLRRTAWPACARFARVTPLHAARASSLGKKPEFPWQLLPIPSAGRQTP